MDNENWEDFWIEYEEKELKNQKSEKFKLAAMKVFISFSLGALLTWLIIKLF